MQDDDDGFGRQRWDEESEPESSVVADDDDGDYIDLDSDKDMSSDDDSTFGGNSKKRKAGKDEEIPKIKKAKPIPEITTVRDRPKIEEKEAEDKLKGIDESVLEKIRKAFALANHANTGEDEAKQALRTASRLMAKINITMADLMAKESEAERLKRAGKTVVRVTPNPDHPSNRYVDRERATIKDWQHGAGHAICTFFDVKVYTQKRVGRDPYVDWCFYGIDQNTVAAAEAFKMVHDSILTWSLDESKELKGTRAIISYRRGVANGLWETACEEKDKEERDAREMEAKELREREEQERLEREKELKRLEGNTVVIEDVEEEVGQARQEPAPEPQLTTTNRQEPRPVEPEFLPEDANYDDESDNDDYAEDGGGGGDGGMDADFSDSDGPDEATEGQLLAELDALRDVSNDPSPAAAPAPVPEPARDPTPVPADVDAATVFGIPDAEPIEWKSVTALVAFRKNAEQVADEYLQQASIKVKKGRKNYHQPKNDRKAFNKGKEDSRQLDVKRRRIE